MLTRSTRWLVLVVLALGVVALVRLWPDPPSRNHDMARHSSSAARQPAPGAEPTRVDSAAPASIAADRAGSAGTLELATGTMEASRHASAAPMQMQVHAPANVRVGEAFQASVDLQANGGVRQLMFAVTYDKSRLALVAWSEGTLAQQGGLPAELGVQEPSDGNVEVTFGIGNGHAAAGAGSIAVLQFEAIKAGTSRIALQSIAAIDGTGARTSDVAVVREGAVTIR